MKNAKRVRNEVVVKTWGSLIGGERENDGELREVSNDSGSFRVYNDGTVYSYRLLIGEIKDGVHIVYDHTSKGGSFYSKTTSNHVNSLKAYALKIVDYK
jgi:hypothetical protein